MHNIIIKLTELDIAKITCYQCKYVDKTRDDYLAGTNFSCKMYKLKECNKILNTFEIIIPYIIKIEN